MENRQLVTISADQAGFVMSGRGPGHLAIARAANGREASDGRMIRASRVPSFEEANDFILEVPR